MFDWRQQDRDADQLLLMQRPRGCDSLAESQACGGDQVQCGRGRREEGGVSGGDGSLPPALVPERSISRLDLETWETWNSIKIHRS